MSLWLDDISKKITVPKKIVFPEGEALDVIEAAYKAYSDRVCLPYLIGDKSKIEENCKQLGIPHSDWWQSLVPSEELDELLENPKIVALPIHPDALKFLLTDPLFFSAAMLRTGEVDSVVAGYTYTTGEVVSAGNMFLSKEEEGALASSYFVMDIPGFDGSEKELLIFADCGVNIEPSAQEIAHIAIDTARSAQVLLDWEPRVALLSSSTKGSIEHENVEKMRQALEIIQELEPTLKVDGELQGDAALSEKVANKKVGENSEVAGKANILIFPNLDAGNIAYKLTSQLAKADAYGPLLQGLAKPMFDLSRGSSSTEIYGVIKIASVFAEAGISQ